MHKKATYNIAVGLALRELHNERHIDRKTLADALDTTELAVTRVETAEQRLTAGELILMLELFNLSWDEFMKRVKRNLNRAEAGIT